uniref:Glycine N-acyltransferase-like protein n=1 Tax=Salvator merianae TaxID=96440 RepID=A0A8D0BV00_SALMN
AMLILSCPSKLRMLEEMLRKSLPQALQTHGVVMNINRGNPVGHEAVVDAWPEFKAVLTRPRKEVIIFEILWGLLFSTGNKDGMFEALTEAAAARKVQLTATPYVTYVHPDPKLSLCNYPGFTLSSLNSSHIDQLNTTWLPGGNTEHSRRYLADMVQYFPSACVQDSSGQVVSWSLMHPVAAGDHAYTLPSYRGKHFFPVAFRALSMQIQAAGYPMYGCVALNNVRMQNVMDNCGFQRVSELSRSSWEVSNCICIT